MAEELRIVAGAGHGGGGVTPGKRTPDGEYEWDFNNIVVNGFIDELDTYEGVSVKRVDDHDVLDGYEDVPLATRVRIANNWKAHYYFSFHQNAYKSVWGNHGGTETFYYEGSAEGKRVAQIVQDAVMEVFGLRNRGIKRGNHLYVIKNTNMPAVLNEGGFMDSLTDIKVLRDKDKLYKAGQNVAKKFAEYKKLRKRKEAVNVPTKPDAGKELYRVRQNWADGFAGQLGAFYNLAHAKDLADQHAGYKVFDSKGKVVYTGKQASVNTYTVKAGDTLWGISRTFGVSVTALKNANGLKDDLIRTGQKLTIPGASKPAPAPQTKQPSAPKQLGVGSKVKIKASATKYATGQNIPSYVKGKTYTIQQVKVDRFLLKEIMSWVYTKDVE